MSEWLAVLAGHSFLLAALLIGHGRRRVPANGLLAAFVAVAGLFLLESWIGAAGHWRSVPHLLGVFAPFWLALGPLGYLYVRRSTGAPPARGELLLAVPSLSAFVALMPFYALRADEKLALASSGHPTATLVLYLSFSTVTAACAWASARRLSFAASREGSEPSWRSAWLRLLMGLLAIYAAVDALATGWFALRGGYPAALGWASLGVLSTLVYSIGYLVVLPEGLLARAAEVAQIPPPRARSEISPGRAEVLERRLDLLMEEDEPWRNDELRLDDLAQQLRVSRHHLSHLFSRHLETRFRDYVNARRVAEVRRHLLDRERKGSVLDAAFAAGFGSSASFYRAFRKEVGCTPKQFIEAAEFDRASSDRARRANAGS